MTSDVAALSGIVANGHQAIHFVSSAPSKIPYGGFSPVRLQTGITGRSSLDKTRPAYTSRKLRGIGGERLATRASIFQASPLSGDTYQMMFMGKSFLARGEFYEMEELALMSRYMTPNTRYLDVGTNSLGRAVDAH